MSRAAFKSSAALGRSRYRLGLAAWMAFMAFHATVLGLVFTSAPALPTAAPAALALWLAAQVVLLLPFEYLSGHHFPKKIGREIAFSVWLGQWARATAIQLALFGLFAALIMGSAAMVGHNWGGWLRKKQAGKRQRQRCCSCGCLPAGAVLPHVVFACHCMNLL